MMMREAFDWLKPRPLWENGLQNARSPDFFQPQLAQMTDDNFMATFRAAAGSSDPSQLKALILSPPADAPLKLFQAAHGCHYLVCATLSCRMPGFPDRGIQRPQGESVFFVMRRFINGAEYGWVVNGTQKSWQPLNGQVRRVLDGEQRQPLFPLTGSDKHTMLVGYMPVASGDVYSISVADFNAAASTGETIFPIDVRIEELEGRFTTPLTKYVTEIQHNSNLISVYLLLELLEFFATYLPNVAAALGYPTQGGPPSTAEQQLLTSLSSQIVGGGTALDAALRAVAGQRAALEQTGGADPTTLGLGNYDLTTGSIDTDGLVNAVQLALPPDTSTLFVPRLNAVGETYAVRCVYERPQCSPVLQVLSQPSQSFQLAAFFDADAPARPIRIVMPTDVSLAGIRKFQKGVTFIISNSLQDKINMLTGNERSILKDPPPGLSAAATGVGWMCSFSFQIIFIVAFFLLLMFVIILNICFWWIAFFKICIPYPKKLLSG